MPRVARTLLVILLGIFGVAIIAFLSLVGFYTVKIRRGENIPGITDRFTRAHGAARTVPLSREVLAQVTTATGDPSFGASNAPIQIVEFADAECPYSAEFSQTLRKAMLAYPDKFHFVFRDFPLEDIHDHAMGGALALSCANAQGKFWQMHDKVFGNQDKLAPIDLQNYAAQVGLNMDTFRECLIKPATKKEIMQDVADGTAAGVSGTPTFFINGHKVEGVIPATIFEKLLKQSLP